ncbi:MAG: hypothetical protein ACI4WW_09300 [Candidatus Coprovivens sp.]
MAKVDETTEVVEKVEVKKDKKEIKKQAKEIKKAAKESKKKTKENEKLKKLDKMEAKELKKKKKEKKKGGVLKTVFIAFFSTILICLAIVGVIYYAWTGGFDDWFKPKKSAVETKVLDSLDDYGYSLSDKDTDAFKDEYNTLKDILNEKKIDEEKYAEQVARMFVMDLYTISTKVNKLDIGGSEYFYIDKVSMYELKVMDTLYSNLLDNTYGDRTQELPTVSSVETISVEKGTYMVGAEEKEAYIVKVKWTYEKDMGYDSIGTVILCKENGKRISVVEYQSN